MKVNVSRIRLPLSWNRSKASLVFSDVYKRMGDPVPNNGNPRILFAGEACSKNFWYKHSY
jgi:hypothetical protein